MAWNRRMSTPPAISTLYLAHLFPMPVPNGYRREGEKEAEFRKQFILGDSKDALLRFNTQLQTRRQISDG